MRAHGVESYREYMKILDSDTLEYNKLMDCLTINVTQFFRDSATFEALEKVVLPQLVSDKQNRKSRVIRAWSAGCASGEEPFSKVAEDRLGGRTELLPLAVPLYPIIYNRRFLL